MGSWNVTLVLLWLSEILQSCWERCECYNYEELFPKSSHENPSETVASWWCPGQWEISHSPHICFSPLCQYGASAWTPCAQVQQEAHPSDGAASRWCEPPEDRLVEDEVCSDVCRWFAASISFPVCSPIFVERGKKIGPPTSWFVKCQFCGPHKTFP